MGKKWLFTGVKVCCTPIIYIATVAILDDNMVSDYNFDSRHPNDDSGQHWLKMAQRFQDILLNSFTSDSKQVMANAHPMLRAK